MNYNRMIDHTILKPDATRVMVQKVIDEAKQYHFASVCVNPTWVNYCKKQLADSDVKVCTVVGFPLGANTTKVKAFETRDAIENGADEIDMVINIGALKDQNFNLVLEDIEEVVMAANGKCVKVIIETCLLTEQEIIIACKLAEEARATFVKTSTGFSTAGAKASDVALMKRTVGNAMEVKAAGGIKTKEDLEAMVKAGASRIGTSAGVKLVEG
ncbi:deoxyribose-phosphate aldolase [uncultured Thomasclavelia sp.]|uniref:deoxyribose-phosphate aldolase n=1 Tax=uncultured Thomasclavelia sp. TaxID=3025759 RepID=UPI0025DFE752|nr:deoxyribose-phosphate aldolase [uncultured Thomasclavelia sp.]